jgi:hypothetical protein
LSASPVASLTRTLVAPQASPGATSAFHLITLAGCQRLKLAITSVVPVTGTLRGAAVQRDGDAVWWEWEMSGTRVNGIAQQVAGVILFGVRDGRFPGPGSTWSRCRRRARRQPGSAPPPQARCQAAVRIRGMIAIAGGTGTLGTRRVSRLVSEVTRCGC